MLDAEQRRGLYFPKGMSTRATKAFVNKSLNDLQVLKNLECLDREIKDTERYIK